MVKPVTKGNLSQNTDPSGTVKIKHGGLEEQCHSSAKSYVKTENTHTHVHTRTDTHTMSDNAVCFNFSEREKVICS